METAATVAMVAVAMAVAMASPAAFSASSLSTTCRVLGRGTGGWVGGLWREG